MDADEIVDEQVIDPLDIANMTEDESFTWLISIGYRVTRRTVKWAVLRREIHPTRLGAKNYFSQRDWLRWIESRKQTGIYRAAEGV